MSPLSPAVALAIAALAVAASPAAAKEGPAPIAHAAGGGGGAAPTYPGLVNSRLVRTQKGLDRAIGYADDGGTAEAAAHLYTPRPHGKLAWRAAEDVIQHAPPPVGGGEDRRPRPTGGAP